MPSKAIRISRVFVTQEMDKLNYLPAQKFGDITFLTRTEFSPVANSLNNQNLMKDVRTKLAEFDPDIDYIVFSGSPTVAAAVFAHLGRHHNSFTVLRWSNRDAFYSPITIQIEG